MACRAQRAAFALRFEALEPRTLLSGSTADEFFVRFKPELSGATIQQALSTVGASVVDQYPSGPMLISLRPGIDESRALQWLEHNPVVSYAEPNAAIHSEAIPSINDPYSNQLWGLNNPNNVDIDAPEAWGITQGRYTTVVAVLDTGIDLGNPEFANRLWSNPDGGSGADGFAGDIHGWNFVNNSANVQDNNGHGSHVAGILGAAGNNGDGVAGVDWYSLLMPVKVLDSAGDGTTDDAVKGIYYAVNHGARVINASWGGGQYSQALRDAIAYAGSKNVVFVTAAGNDGLNNDVASSYPGSYRLNNEITVGAVDAAGNLADFSDYGARTVDLVAPGVNITSTIPGGFATYSGTSMATPYVAGVASLVLSLHPEFTAQEVVQRILGTTKPVGGAAGKTVTGGIVDAYNAVNFGNIVTSASTESFGIPTAVALVPNGTSDRDVLAKIFATDDMYKSFGATNAGYVTGLFRSILGRDPSQADVADWAGRLDAGQTRVQVVESLEWTTEALQTKVARWYRDVLGWSTPLARLKSDPGIVYWGGMLAAGQSEDSVLARILATNDFFSGSGGTNEGFVTALYQSLLARTPDPQGFQYLLDLLRGGKSRLDVARTLENGIEAKNVKVGRWYQEQLGSPLSLGELKDNSGVRYWARFLSNA